MKLVYKILATFFLAQSALASGFPLYHMQSQQQGIQQQNAHQSSMPAPQWHTQGPRPQMSPMQWPTMMSGPMQRFGQAPQMPIGGYGAAAQIGGAGFMGQQQSLNVPAAQGATPAMGTGLSPQVQNQSRRPAGGNGMMGTGPTNQGQAPQQGFQNPQAQGYNNGLGR